MINEIPSPKNSPTGGQTDVTLEFLHLNFTPTLEVIEAGIANSPKNNTPANHDMIYFNESSLDVLVTEERWVSHDDK